MAEPHISIIIEYRVEPQNLRPFLDRLKRNSRETLADDGCLRMEISQPIAGKPGTVFLAELWRNQASIDAHRQKPGHDDGHAAVDALVADKRVVKGHILDLD